jgi:hypothetical protein
MINTPLLTLAMVALALSFVISSFFPSVVAQNVVGRCQNEMMFEYPACTRTNFLSPRCQEIQRSCKIPPPTLMAGRKY